MQSDFFPDRESDMLVWSANFFERIRADAAALGLSVAQVDAFAAVRLDFVEAMERCAPGVRSASAVIVKNQARLAMERSARALSRFIQSQPQVTDEQRALLGLNVRARSNAPLPAPASPPVLQVSDVRGGRVTLLLRSAANTTSRARPRGAAGATLWYFVGDAPPTDPRAWTLYGNTSLTKATIALDSLAPNTPVWVCGRWYSRRGELGPPAEPVQTWTTHSGPALPTQVGTLPVQAGQSASAARAA